MVNSRVRIASAFRPGCRLHMSVIRHPGRVVLLAGVRQHPIRRHSDHLRGEFAGRKAKLDHYQTPSRQPTLSRWARNRKPPPTRGMIYR